MSPRLYQFPWMDEDIEAFRDQVRRYIQTELAPHVPEWQSQGYVPREVWRGMGELGFLLPEMPVEYGGSGVTKAYQLVIQDELSKVELSGILAVHTIVSHYILAYGSEEQRNYWLPKLVNGEHLGGIAMTEPGHGSDLKSLLTRARRDGDDYVINGSKTFITNGFSGSMLAVACRTGGDGASGISLILIATENLPGFTVSSRLKKLGQHASDTAELSFDEVRVPASHLLGETEGQGFIQIMGQLPFERLLLAVPAAAQIELALELTTAHTKDRKMFGGTLFDMQNTRFKLAEAATTAHIVRSFVNDCIQRLIDGTLDNEAAYMAKWWCTEQQCKVTDECLQLFGGYGYMTEYPIARMFADARVQKIYGGANEVMKELISRAL